jgi:hypothetical protein
MTSHALDNKVIDLPMLRLADILRNWDSLRHRVSTIDMAMRAARRYGEAGDGLFTTACYQSLVRDEIGWTPTGDVVAEILSAEPRIVRLRGGCYWMILPGGHERYAHREGRTAND